MDAKILLAFAVLGVCVYSSYADGYNRGNGYGHSHGHGHRRVQHYRGANEYRPYGNVMNLDNGHFGYDPNDGTYGQPHKHNAKLGYGGYGNLINNGYGFGYQYGVLGRAEPKGYNKWNPYDILNSLNRRQIHYNNAY